MTDASFRDLPRLGGHLALDFVNTIDPRYGPDRVEFLGSPAALADWGRWIGMLSVDEHRRAVEAAETDRPHAERVWRRALRLRDDLHVLLRPERDQSRLGAAAATLSRELRQSAAHLELRPMRDGYELELERPPALEVILWNVSRAAADLMTSPAQLGRVHECSGQNCGWLFLDTSRAGRRRWCSMEICGNRVKARRYRERQRDVAAA